MKKQSVISLKLSLVLVLTVLLLAVGSQAAMAASINLTKTVFSPTESITLSFTADSAYPDSAWNGTEQKVTLNLNGKSIELWIGNKNTRVNGVNKITDVAPQIIGGRTMLPLRFVTENFGCNVDWDGVTQKVTIKVN
jgi:hypothetical protein